jgi:hypothetical protein
MREYSTAAIQSFHPVVQVPFFSTPLNRVTLRFPVTVYKTKTRPIRWKIDGKRNAVISQMGDRIFCRNEATSDMNY